VSGRDAAMRLAPRQSGSISIDMPPGFPYKYDLDRPEPTYVWVMSVSADAGFVPADVEQSTDTRYLGVRVKPVILK
jgi:hypothetical protein